MATATWGTWIEDPSWAYTTTATSTTGWYLNQNTVWQDWVNTTATTSTTLRIAQNAVWNDWQYHGQNLEWYTTPPETPEERQAREDRLQARREEDSRARLAAKTRMEGAQERAMELLMTVLTNEERVWHDQHDEIMVRAESGRIYVIEKRGVHGNIREVDEHGCILGRVCVAPGMYDGGAQAALPLADGWLGQYLAIKHNEEYLRATGNWSRRAACVQPDVPVLRAA